MATKKAPGTAEKKATTKTAAKAPAKSAASKAPAKTASNKAAGTQQQHAPSHQEIADLAHQYWIERGRAHGGHESDWLRAEATLKQK